MWRTSGADGPVPGPGAGGADDAPLPSDNEVPVTVPVSLVLARTDDTAVLLSGAQVYRNGANLDLVAVSRRGGSGRALTLSVHGPLERGERLGPAMGIVRHR